MTVTKSLPSLASLSNILLRKANGEEILAKQLWQDAPTVIVGIRRPGCMLCREEAAKIWQRKEDFDKIGARLVCVVHEWKELEVNAFHPAYWPGELYHDADKGFYKAFGEGSVRKGSLLDLLNPFGQAWKNMNRAKSSGLVKDSNLNGDGFTLGGLLVLRKGEGGVVFMHQETTFGDHADVEEVLKAAAAAASE